jgi:acyl-lipid omega-6 desaturase (Delta-12 desaturase)
MSWALFYSFVVFKWRLLFYLVIFWSQSHSFVATFFHDSVQMSTFTMVHHTAPHIPFKSSEEWNAAQAQLNGTVHCNYPRWYVF